MEAAAEDRVRKPRYPNDVFDQMASAMYEAKLKPILEPTQIGRIVAFDIETGDYEVADEPAEPTHKLIDRKWDAQIMAMRIGGGGVVRFGGL